MKKINRFILFISCVMLFNNVFGQSSNAILFTENGERFTIILNGVRQNTEPETNVKVTGLNAEFYKLKVIFTNTMLGEKNFNLYLNHGTETSYSIRKNSKGEYVIRLVSEVPMAEAPTASPSQTIIVYADNPAAAPQVGTVTQTTITETTTATQPQDDNVNINMGVHVSGDGGNISISASGMNGEDEKAHTTVVHTTTTTTHTVTSHPAPVRPPSYLPGYTGPIGCPVPMSPGEFSDFKSAISAKTFEDTRMSIAKEGLSDHCMLSSQVKEVMLLFTFEENKLDFAKYAYDHTYDIGNYFKVNNAFTFENSTEELNQYINSHK